jgi:hypothetical protein
MSQVTCSYVAGQLVGLATCNLRASPFSDFLTAFPTLSQLLSSSMASTLHWNMHGRRQASTSPPQPLPRIGTESATPSSFQFPVHQSPVPSISTRKLLLNVTALKKLLKSCKWCNSLLSCLLSTLLRDPTVGDT